MQEQHLGPDKIIGEKRKKEAAIGQRMAASFFLHNDQKIYQYSDLNFAVSSSITFLSIR